MCVILPTRQVPNEALNLMTEAVSSLWQELPKDFQRLFNDNLFKFDTNLIPEAVALYEQLGVKHEPLSLIPPQFECPLPPLNPAVFPPALRELPPPALDQYDLDEHFASPRQRRLFSFFSRLLPRSSRQSPMACRPPRGGGFRGLQL